MRQFKQKYYECALAAVCMATGKDYPYRSRQFHERHGFMFGDSPTHQEWIGIAEDYLRELNQGMRPEWFLGKDIDFPPLKDQRISLAGQGVLSVIQIPYRHTMAFCAGKIYDPQESYIVSWREWKKRNPDWKVYNVTRMDRKNYLPTVAK